MSLIPNTFVPVSAIELREMRAKSIETTKKWIAEELVVCKTYERRLLDNSENARKFTQIKQTVKKMFDDYRIPERLVKREIYNKMSRNEKAAHNVETFRLKTVHFGGTIDELIRAKCLAQPDGQVVYDPSTVVNPTIPESYLLINDYVNICQKIVETGSAKLLRYTTKFDDPDVFTEDDKLVKLLVSLGMTCLIASLSEDVTDHMSATSYRSANDEKYQRIISILTVIV